MADNNNNGIDDMIEVSQIADPVARAKVIAYLQMLNGGADPWGYSNPTGYVAGPPIAAQPKVPETIQAPSWLGADEQQLVNEYQRLLANPMDPWEYVNPLGYQPAGPIAATPRPVAPAPVLTPEQEAMVAAANPQYDTWDYINPLTGQGRTPVMSTPSRPPSVRYQPEVQPKPVAPAADADKYTVYIDSNTGAVKLIPKSPSNGGYSYAGIDISNMPKTTVQHAPSQYTSSGGFTNYVDAAANAPTDVASNFEARLAATDVGKNLGTQTNETFVPADTSAGTVDDQWATVFSALGLNPDGSPRNNTNGGSGPSQAVLSPAQIQSMIDTLTSQSQTASMGVGQAYDQADRDMARLMRQYSNAERRSGRRAEGTLTAFGAKPQDYRVGDFGPQQMLAGARADLIGNKAAEMSNWGQQKALYQKLLKDMGG